MLLVQAYSKGKPGQEQGKRQGRPCTRNTGIPGCGLPTTIGPLLRNCGANKWKQVSEGDQGVRAWHDGTCMVTQFC